MLTAKYQVPTLTSIISVIPALAQKSDKNVGPKLLDTLYLTACSHHLREGDPGYARLPLPPLRQVSVPAAQSQLLLRSGRVELEHDTCGTRGQARVWVRLTWRT